MISINKIQIVALVAGSGLGARSIIIISLPPWQLAGKWGYWGMRQRKWLVTYVTSVSLFYTLLFCIMLSCSAENAILILGSELPCNGVPSK